MKRLSALAVLGFLVAACSGETQPAASAEPVMGDMIVVGQRFEALGSAVQFCVSYRAFGVTEETCVSQGDSRFFELLGNSSADFFSCIEETVIGEPLPVVCR